MKTNLIYLMIPYTEAKQGFPKKKQKKQTILKGGLPIS